MAHTFERLPRLCRIKDKVRPFAHRTRKGITARPSKWSNAPRLGIRPDQSTYGCCVSESGTEVVEGFALATLKQTIAMSVSANYAQSQYDFTPKHHKIADDGLPTGASLQTYAVHGYVLDSVRPFPPKNDEKVMLAPVPPGDWITDFRDKQYGGKWVFGAVQSELEELLTAIWECVPGVQIGMTWANSYFSPAADGTLPPPDKNVGGHALVACGYDDDEAYVEVANSWGTGWGYQPVGAASGGYCKIPYSYWTDYPDFVPDDLYAVETD